MTATFSQDQNYGTTLLLPNRNLDPAYQKLDLYRQRTDRKSA